MRNKERLQKKHGVKIGQVYTIWTATEQKETKKRIWKTRRIRILDVYENFVLTETPAGVWECIQWWELKKMMEGPDDRRK